MESKERVVVVYPTGEVSFLYEDGHPLLSLATAKVERVSDVDWDESLQGWTVRFRVPFTHLNERCEGRVFKKRQHALDFEVEAFTEDSLG
jgi:hypothetical protein